jgi:hypothetical protein
MAAAANDRVKRRDGAEIAPFVDLAVPQQPLDG